MKYVYPALICPDDGQFGVTVPDLPGCHVFGETVAEVLFMARDAVEMWLWDAENKKENIPAPSGTLPAEAGETLTLIAADTDSYRRLNDKMDINEYMMLPYNFIIKHLNDESGEYYHASVLELDGCQSTGCSYQEACDNLTEAMEGWIETKLDNNFDIPLPIENDKYSGKFIVRLPKSLHAKLAIEAEKEGVSLNQYTVYKLSN